MGSDVERLSFSFSSPSLLFGVLPPSFSCFSFFLLLLFLSCLTCFPLSPIFSLFPLFPRDAIEVCLPSIDLQSKKKTSRVTKKRIELPSIKVRIDGRPSAIGEHEAVPAAQCISAPSVRRQNYCGAKRAQQRIRLINKIFNWSASRFANRRLTSLPAAEPPASRDQRVRAAVASGYPAAREHRSVKRDTWLR